MANNFLKFVVLLLGLPQVRKCVAREKKDSSMKGKSQGILFEQGKVDILKGQGKLKEFKVRRNIWGHCDLNKLCFSLMKKENFWAA